MTLLLDMPIPTQKKVGEIDIRQGKVGEIRKSPENYG